MTSDSQLKEYLAKMAILEDRFRQIQPRSILFDSQAPERAVWEQAVCALLRCDYTSGEAAIIADRVVNEWRLRFRPQEMSADVSPQAEPIWKDCVNCKTPLKRGPCSVCGAAESENWEVTS